MNAELQTKVQASPAQNFTPAQTGLLQRKSALCNTPGLVEDSGREKEKLTLQRSLVDQAGTTTVPPIVPRFGHDFSRVRVHSAGLGMIQAKLKMNEPGDIYEQEADRVADAVMRMEEPRVQRQMEEEIVQTKPVITPLVQRQSEEEGGEEEFIQTRELPGQSPEVIPTFSSRIQSLKGGGQALPESTRAFFEPRFGHDFSNVRVHTGVNASKIAESVYARAFTLGNNIVFGHGQYSTGTDKGRRLLGHELTHVIQQDKSGFVSGNSRGPISEVSKMRTESIQRSIAPHPEIRGDFIIIVNRGINNELAFIAQVSRDLGSLVQGARVPGLIGIGGFRDLLQICWNEVLSLNRPSQRRITVRLVGWGGVVSRFILITPQVEIPEESRGESESMLPALEESEPIEEIGCPSLESRRIHPPADRNEALWIAHCLNEWHPGWLSTLPACPCSVSGARDSDIFNEDDPLTSMVVECFHPGATYFFRSNPVRLNYEEREFIHGQQCTYDSDGWLITEGAAAGTPDFYNPDEQYDYHQNIDVVPFNQLGWRDYINSWRPNNSNGCIENYVTGTIPLLCRPILE